MSRVLIVEDDIALGRGLRFDLEADNHEVLLVTTASAALGFLQSYTIDLIVLDVNLPDGDGFELLGEFKAIQDIPVIFLTARNQEQDQIRGFSLGADDYITKPFSMPVFRMRVEAVLRRSMPEKSTALYDDGYLCVSFEKLEASAGGTPISLTPTEYKLIRYLMTNAGIVLSKKQLLQNLWDTADNFVDEHVLTVYINRLRAKVEDDHHKYIKTIHRVGYKWEGEKL